MKKSARASGPTASIVLEALGACAERRAPYEGMTLRQAWAEVQAREAATDVAWIVCRDRSERTGVPLPGFDVSAGPWCFNLGEHFIFAPYEMVEAALRAAHPHLFKPKHSRSPKAKPLPEQQQPDPKVTK